MPSNNAWVTQCYNIREFDDRNRNGEVAAIELKSGSVIYARKTRYPTPVLPGMKVDIYTISSNRSFAARVVSVNIIRIVSMKTNSALPNVQMYIRKAGYVPLNISPDNVSSYYAYGRTGDTALAWRDPIISNGAVHSQTIITYDPSDMGTDLACGNNAHVFSAKQAGDYDGDEAPLAVASTAQAERVFKNYRLIDQLDANKYSPVLIGMVYGIVEFYTLFMNGEMYFRAPPDTYEKTTGIDHSRHIVRYVSGKWVDANDELVVDFGIENTWSYKTFEDDRDVLVEFFEHTEWIRGFDYLAAMLPTFIKTKYIYYSDTPIDGEKGYSVLISNGMYFNAVTKLRNIDGVYVPNKMSAKFLKDSMDSVWAKIIESPLKNQTLEYFDHFSRYLSNLVEYNNELSLIAPVDYFSKDNVSTEYDPSNYTISYDTDVKLTSNEVYDVQLVPKDVSTLEYYRTMEGELVETTQTYIITFKNNYRYVGATRFTRNQRADELAYLFYCLVMNIVWNKWGSNIRSYELYSFLSDATQRINKLMSYVFVPNYIEGSVAAGTKYNETFRDHSFFRVGPYNVGSFKLPALPNKRIPYENIDSLASFGIVNSALYNGNRPSEKYVLTAEVVAAQMQHTLGTDIIGLQLKLLAASTKDARCYANGRMTINGLVTNEHQSWIS